MRAASASASALAAAGASSTSGRGPANGRISSAHPSGVAQRSQAAPVEVSAITRSSSDRPTTALPSSSAMRRDGASWLAIAPTPTYTGATDTVASAR